MTSPTTGGRKSKKEILLAILHAGEAAGLCRGGPGPSIERFEATSGIKNAHWKNVYWTKWGDALAEAGYQPNPWGAAKKDAEDLLAALAALARELKKAPTKNDVVFAYNTKRGLFPAQTTFRRRLGLHAQVIGHLREWVADKAEWADVAAMLGPGTNVDVLDPLVQAAPSLGAMVSDSFLLPVLACLAALAEGDERVVQELDGQDRNAEKELERRVSAAFRLLGLRVLEYGQGKGRRADGVAVCIPGSWAVVFDAKLRRELYQTRRVGRQEVQRIHRAPRHGAGADGNQAPILRSDQ